MGRTFTPANFDRLDLASAVITAAPCSFAAWINPSTLSAVSSFSVISVSDTAGNNILDLALNTVAFAQSYNSTTNNAFAQSTLTLSTGTLYHVCAVWTNASSRTIYVNASNSVTDTTAVTPAGVGHSAIASYYNAQSLFSGSIYFPAIWNLALSLPDVTSLFNGCNPRKVRPSGLVSFIRMSAGQSAEPDMCSENAWTISGSSATVAINPRMFP